MVVIGGGIVGAATAREVQKRHPNFKCAILEKEDGFGKCCPSNYEYEGASRIIIAQYNVFLFFMNI